MSSMRRFYGYGRRPEDAPEGCDQTWIDAKGSDRQERADLLLAVRSGDVVTVLARGDLGRGAEVPAIEKAILGRGATLDVREPPKAPPKPPGPRPQFQPDPETDAKIRKLWHSHNVKRYVLQRAQELAGWPVSWDQLRRRYGRRWS